MNDIREETPLPKKESLKEYKRRCKTAAWQLGYGEDVLEAIRNAKTDNEVCRIMRDARINKK